MNIGEVLVERYKILHRLGEGDTGAVYLAKDEHDDALVAVKEVRTALLGDDPSAQLLNSAQLLQLSREFKVLEGLSHPNLPRIRNHFETSRARCLIMDYIDGNTLAEIVTEEGPRDEEQALEFARAACDVLGYLHEHTPPVIFRDLKPGNIMMDADGRYVLLDFGLSKVETRDSRSTNTISRRSGTSGFAPPEQYEGITDPSSDVYSLGATLYFLLTGLVPPSALDITLGNARLKPLKQLCPFLSKHTMNAIGYMLALNRADRLKNIDAVKSMLGLVEKPMAAAAPARPAQPAAPQPTPVVVLEPGTDRSPGEVLNARYRLDCVLAPGRLGSIYRALHLDLDEPVAIKEIQPPIADPELREDCIRQFRQEARVLNRLRHPNLPRVYDFFEQDDRHYVVMEYVAGSTLDQTPDPGEATVLRWASEICDALGYLHGQDPPVIFRDLKPANTLVATDGTLRLIDFGLTTVFETAGDGSVQCDAFTAPEQATGACTPRVDIFALGATLFRVLVGRDPPVGRDACPLLREARPDISERLTVAVEWMMALDESMRPTSIEETRQALGLSAPETPAESPATRVRRLLREEFQHFFPAPWQPRGPLLEAVMAQVSGSRSATLLLLSGAPGVGKSRLLQELCAALQGKLRVLPPIQGSRITRQLPFGALTDPFHELIRQGGQPLLSALLGRLDDTALRETGEVLPELKAIKLDLTGPTLSPQERTRVVLDSLRIVLEETARTAGRVLLVIDDVQLVDPSTLHLIDLLLAIDRPDVPIAIVMARETGSGAEVLEEALKRWKGLSQVAELWVPPFSRQELTDYLRATLPPIESLEVQAETIHTLTGGNPMLVEEIIRWMVMRRLVEAHGDTLAMRPMQAESLPGGVGESVRRRLELLPIDSRELLAVASVIGQQFKVRTLERLSGERAQVVAESLERAHEAVFARPLDGTTWVFASEATREAFSGRLSPSHRRQLHMTLGHMEEYDTGGGARVAYHFEQAGDVARSLEHVSRFSRELLAPSAVEIVVRDSHGAKAWAATRDLDEEQVEKLRQAVAFLVRALKSQANYGPHSLVAQTSLEMAMTVLVDVQKATGPVLINCTETYFSINNKELDPGKAPSELVSTCRRLHISGFEIRPGVDTDQMSRFLGLLTGPYEGITREGGWNKALAARTITKLQVIESIMVEVSERDLFDPAKLRLAQEVVLKEEGAEMAPGFSFEKVQPAPPTRLPTPAAGETPLSAQEVTAQLDSIKELLEELKGHSPGAAPVVSSDAMPVKEVRSQDLLEAWASLSRVTQEEDILRLATLCHLVDKPLTEYMEQRPELLLADLESPQREHRMAAAMALVNQGKRARRVLLNYLAHSDSLQGRSVALFLLTHLVQDVRGLLIARLLESSTEEEVVHLLRAMRDGRMPWEHALEVLLRSSSSQVRRGSAAILLESDFEMRDKAEILRGPLKSDNPLVVLDALLAVSDLGPSDLVGDVARLLERSWSKMSVDHIRSQVQACHTLGKIATAETALPVLRSILSKNLSSTLMGGWHSEVRSAATWGVGMLAGSEARDLLQTLARDPDPAVSGTARLAIDAASRVRADVLEISAQVIEGLP